MNAMISVNNIDLTSVIALVQSVALCPELSSEKLHLQQCDYQRYVFLIFVMMPLFQLISI